VAAADIPASTVYKRIAHLIDYVADQLRAGELPCVDLPDAHHANAIYDDRGNVFLGNGLRRLMLADKDVLAFMRIMLALGLAFENVQHGTRVTKRGLYYYQQLKLPDNRCAQDCSDRALAALSNILRVRRKALGFVEAPRGSIWGRLAVRDGGEVVDVSRLGPGGWTVPRFKDDVEILDSDAAFILVVEKDAIAFRLFEAQWHNTYPSIVVCPSGLPSYSMREFTRRLVDTLRIPAFVCADGDPGGVRLALTCAHGAISSALETPWLACNDIWWVGLCPSDIDRFGIGESAHSLDKDELKEANALLHHPSAAYVNERVRQELALMIDRRVKTELEAVSENISFFVGEYLPRKLFDADLVKL
jgi:DNA topoisomerase-6 subunit A